MNIDRNDLEEDYSFKIKNNDGTETICDTLAVVKPEGYDEPMIIYTDYTFDAEKKFNTYISKLVEVENGFILENIDNYEAIPEVMTALNQINN